MEVKRQTRKIHEPERASEHDYITGLIERKRAKTVTQLLKSLSPDEFRLLYGQLGSSYKDKIKAILQYHNIQHNNTTHNTNLLTSLAKITTTVKFEILGSSKSSYVLFSKFWK